MQKLSKFLKTKQGKWLLGLTILAVIAAGLGIFKVWSDHQKYEIMQSKVNAPVTQKLSKDTLRKDKIHMFTDDDLA